MSLQFHHIISMEFPELSLSLAANNNDDGHHQDLRLPMKRKIQNSTGSVDLHQPWKEPLPLDWEQCLDLQSGRMYYVNRKTMKKTWEWPKDQKQSQLNLDLNISTTGHSYEEHHHRHHKKQHYPSSSSSPPSNGSGAAGGENMIALPCSNCHLLVIVSQASPSCPNCKFVQYSAAGGNRSPADPYHSGGLSLFN